MSHMELTKEQIENLYKGGLTQKEIAIKFGSSQSEISRLMKNYGIKTNKSWTDEEIEYLENSYGNYSIKTISKRLGRTEVAISIKAKRLGLNCFLNSEKLTAADLARAFRIDRHVVMDNWIKNKGLKASYKIVKSSRKYWRIDIEDFWKWSYKNRKIINFSKLERHILGAEPEWVEIERKKDYMHIPKRQACKWTKEEDEKLAMLYPNMNYTLKQIGGMLGKSEAAVNRRRKRIGVKPRKICLKWQQEEIDLLINLKLKGALDKEIAWELGRDEGNVSWKRKELIKCGQLNWKYRENIAI